MMTSIRQLRVSDLKDVLACSKEIFQPTAAEEQKYHQPTEWEHVLMHGGLLVGAFVDDRLAGFIIARRDGPEHLHIWNGGVSMAYRQLGLMTTMMGECEQFARQQHITRLTANTFPAKFPAMYRLLPHLGYTCYKEETVDVANPATKKSFFEKYLR